MDKPIILITGAAGLIGSHLIQVLQRAYDVVALDLHEPDCPGAMFDFVRCDLTEDDSVAQALSELRAVHGSRLFGVIHLAAYYDFSGEPSPLYNELTVQGTRRLLQQLQAFDVDRFVFSSSLLVMRPTAGPKLLTELSPVEAEWDYPESKLRAERVIAREHGSIPAAILRIAGIYDEDCHSIPIAQQIRRICEREVESFFFPGNPNHGQSFVHLYDVANCVLRVLERSDQLESIEVFLVGERDVMTYAELQHVIGETLYGHEWPTIRIPKPLAKAGAWVEDKLATDEGPFIKPWMVDMADAHYPVNPAKARVKLGWQPTYSLRRTLPTMLSRLKNNPQHWYQENNLKLPASLTL